MDRDIYSAPHLQSGHTGDYEEPSKETPPRDDATASSAAENRGKRPPDQVSGVVRGSGAGAGGGGNAEEYDSDSAGGSGTVRPSVDHGEDASGADAPVSGSR